MAVGGGSGSHRDAGFTITSVCNWLTATVTGSQREAVTQLDFEATCWRCRATLKCDSLVFIHRNCMTHTFSVLVNNILSESLPKRRLFNLDLNFLWLCPTMHHIIRYRITEEGLCDCVIFP